MADIGDIVGSLMAGLIRARRIADEQTAALAEYYRDNPLLEGLSVPRVRVPELTIELPFIIEEHTEGEAGTMADTSKIATAAETQLKETLSEKGIDTGAELSKVFVDRVKSNLSSIKRLGIPAQKEAVVRSVQDAFVEALEKTKATLTASQKEAITKDLRSKISTVGIAKKPVLPGIVANVKTADVKEKASDLNVVRLKITLKEEGLEWAVHSSESGGVVRTLQPE